MIDFMVEHILFVMPLVAGLGLIFYGLFGVFSMWTRWGRYRMGRAESRREQNEDVRRFYYYLGRFGVSRAVDVSEEESLVRAGAYPRDTAKRISEREQRGA